jgi:FtsH-binding integral membrane protein
MVEGFFLTSSDLIEQFIEKRAKTPQRSMSKIRTYVWIAVLAVVAVVLGTYYLAYIIHALGLGAIIYFALVAVSLALLFLLERFIHNLADDAKFFIYVSFVLFLIAVTLQFYQLLAFPLP